MKSEVKRFGITFMLTLGVITVKTSAIKFESISDPVSESEIHMEAWMTNAALFTSLDHNKDSVINLAARKQDYSIFAEALRKIDLERDLHADGRYTLFAPNNEAFNELFDNFGIRGIDDMGADELVPILSYHLVDRKIMSSDLTTTTLSTLNHGAEIKVERSDGIKLNSSKIIAEDMEGANGVMHGIDKVLLPQKD